MQVADINNPGERKKMIWAGVLGIVALILLWWAFIGFGGSSTPRTPSRPVTQPGPAVTVNPRTQPGAALQVDVMDQVQPLNFLNSVPAVPEPRRNIFAYYERPPAPTPAPPSPSPVPPPPLLLAGLSPSNVYARTGDFTLEVSGDKFTSQVRVAIDNIEVPTKYRGPQQLTATVPASVIASPGGRQVSVRSPDGSLYSNTIALTVAAPPLPNYSYIGIIGTPRYIDTAILQDKNNRELLNVQRGDLLGGRFRVTSISEKELVVMDTNLKIKHTIGFSTQSDRGNPLQRPTPRVETEDDEP